MGCLKITYDYPVGALEVNRKFSVGALEKNALIEKNRLNAYTFGFNGMEKDDEVFNSSGTSYTAEFWQYDSRIGRRWNLDPKPNPAISQYATFACNPIVFTDVLGDTIRKTTAFKNDKNAMKRYDLWAKSRAGKRFIKRYDEGGKHGDVSVVFDIFTEEENDGYASARTYTYGVNDKNEQRGLKLGEGLESGEYLRIRLAFDDKSSTARSSKFRDKRDGGLIILHETQHLRINHYTIMMYNKSVYTSQEHHHIMRGNKESYGLNRDFTNGEKYFVTPNKIYDFNAERWGFMNEFRLKGETNEKIEREIGGFRN